MDDKIRSAFLKSFQQICIENIYFTHTVALKASIFLKVDNFQEFQFTLDKTVSQNDAFIYKVTTQKIDAWTQSVSDDGYDDKRSPRNHTDEVELQKIDVCVQTEPTVTGSLAASPSILPSRRKRKSNIRKKSDPDFIPDAEVKQEVESDPDFESPDLSDDDIDAEEVVKVIPTSAKESGRQNTKDELINCPLCPSEFKDQHSAEKHLKEKHDIGNVYVCSVCQEICPSNAALALHNQSHKGRELSPPSPPAQPVVGRKRGRKPLPKKILKVKHSQSHAKRPAKVKPVAVLRQTRQRMSTVTKSGSSQGGIKCQTCGKAYCSKRALRRHINNIHQLKRHQCELCGKCFTGKESLYHHKRGLHSDSKPYKCNQCDKSFNFNHSYKLHLLKHSGLRPHQCNVCGKTYLTSNHLKIHLEAVHGDKKNYKCSTCGKRFSYTTSLKMHEMTHTDHRPYRCSICNQGFVNSHALKYHLEAKHSTGQSFECDLCGKTYKTEFLMKTHRRRHTADGSRFMCDVCGRQFMYRSTLEAHAVVHQEGKTFQCSECGKSFKTYATLYSHQYVHKTDSPFKCVECGKAFKTKERCKAHERRHSGLKPYDCDLCGRCFPDKGGLSKHKKTVHCAVKRFVCQTCGKACSRADNLRVHMRIHGGKGSEVNNSNPNLSEADSPPTMVSFPNTHNDHMNNPAPSSPVSTPPSAMMQHNSNMAPEVMAVESSSIQRPPVSVHSESHGHNMLHEPLTPDSSLPQPADLTLAPSMQHHGHALSTNPPSLASGSYMYMWPYMYPPASGQTHDSTGYY